MYEPLFLFSVSQKSYGPPEEVIFFQSTGLSYSNK